MKDKKSVKTAEVHSKLHISDVKEEIRSSKYLLSCYLQIV